MIFLAVIAFIFGLLSQQRMALAPFGAATLALIAVLVVAGAAMGKSGFEIFCTVLATLVAAQAGYALGLAIEVRRSRSRLPGPIDSENSPHSNIDGIP